MKFECARTKTLKKSFAFGIISIDYFKELNKEYGFQKGNKVIENVSGIIENSIKDVDWCARWFGVEFAVFIDNEEKESAVKILFENIKHKIHNKKFGIGELLSVTVSIWCKIHSKRGDNNTRQINRQSKGGTNQSPRIRKRYSLYKLKQI